MENNNTEKTIFSIKVQIFIATYLTLFLFLVFSEFLNAFFNIKYDNQGLSLLQRIPFAFKPTVMGLYVVFTSIIYFKAIGYLKPLFRYIKSGEDYKKARVAAIKIPWMIIYFQIFTWAAGTTAYYILKKWDADSGIPYFFGLSLKVVSGFISSVYVAFMINLILKEAKEKLNITSIGDNENDKFAKNKNIIATIASTLYLLLNFLYIAYYFANSDRVFELGTFISYSLPMGIILGVICIVPIFLSRMEYKFQIRSLMREMGKLTDGNSSFSDNINLINFDELGEMAALVNIILQRFNTILASIKNAVEKLLSVSNSLSSTSQQTSSISNQQAAAVAEVVSTMEDSDRLSKTIGNKANDVLSKSRIMNDLVSQGNNVMEENLYTNQEIKKANEKTIDFITELNDDIKAIRDVVVMINAIADQIKIIAFNAELEASAAGEAGKNFEIVASEIRRLADNTFTSTNEIKNKIGTIEKSGNRLVDASNNATDLIEEGLEISHKAGSIFEDILVSSNESSQSSESIAQNIEMQIQGFEQILQAMKQISEGLSYSADSTTTTSDMVNELTDLIDSLKKLVL